MEGFFQNGVVSRYVYAFMAQPLAADTPPLCLAAFGTDNKFTAAQVYKRHKWVKEQAAEFGVTVDVFSSDGDPRLLKAMKSGAGEKDSNTLGVPSELLLFNIDRGVAYVQDTVHIGTKLRTRLLKPSICLPLGRYIVSPSHLRALMMDFSRGHHFLQAYDLEPADKMNFPAVQRMTDEKVRELLRQHVADSDGTVAYLDMTAGILAAYLEKNLRPEERIHKIWRSLFFFRLWRAWLEKNGYSPVDNFTTGNTLMCVELNAHSLVKVLRMKRMEGTSEQFLPWLMSSQPCESLFRAARSMSSTSSTMVNFSLFDFIRKIHRLDLQLQISNSLGNDFNFPRSRRKAMENKETEANIAEYELPSDSAISSIILRASEDALILSNKIGMDVSACDLNAHNLKNIIQEDVDLDLHITERGGDSDDVTEPSMDQEVAEDLCVISTGALKLTDHSASTILDNPVSPFTKVKDTSGSILVVRKSTLCWLLSAGCSKLSADRLHRVKSANNITRYSSNNSNLVLNCERKSKVHICDWCTFEEAQRGTEGILIGMIIGFEYLSGKGKQRQYSLLDAPTDSPRNARGLGSLCATYVLDSEGCLKRTEGDTFKMLNLNSYVCSMPKPRLTEGHLTYDTDVMEGILLLMNA